VRWVIELNHEGGLNNRRRDAVEMVHRWEVETVNDGVRCSRSWTRLATIGSL